MMRTLIITVLTLFLFSCTDNQEFDIPNNNPNGDYNYSSSSVYYDNKESITNTSSNTGALYLSTISDAGTISSTPLLGWGYDIRITNITTHSLPSGGTAQSFRISVQSVTSNSQDFNIRGTGSTELRDPIDGSLIGTYDGIIIDNELNYQFESINIETLEKTISTIEASRAN